MASNKLIAFFYCGHVVHITDTIIDTRAQKMVSHTAVRITESVFLHDQHWEEQNTLSSPVHHNCIVIHKSTKSG